MIFAALKYQTTPNTFIVFVTQKPICDFLKTPR